MFTRTLTVFSALALGLAIGCSDDNDKPSEPVPPGRPHVVRVPLDKATIQAAVDAAEEGDTVEVHDGVWRGSGNRDIDFFGKPVVVKSLNGPAVTIINIQGSGDNPHRAFIFQNAIDSNAVIDGFTMKNGLIGEGGAIWLRSADPIIRNCIFVNNSSTLSGGTVRCKSADPIFRNCTFVGSESPVGGFLYCIAGARPRFENCIVAFGRGGGTVGLSRSSDSANFSCSNIFGNEGGDWTEEIAAQEDVEGNLSADPQFCDSSRADYRLKISSPCVPDNNDCGEWIGAMDTTGCQ